MKFLVPNYSCLQNPWLGRYRPQIPVRSVLCPPPPEQNSWVSHCCHLCWSDCGSKERMNWSGYECGSLVGHIPFRSPTPSNCFLKPLPSAFTSTQFLQRRRRRRHVPPKRRHYPPTQQSEYKCSLFPSLIPFIMYTAPPTLFPPPATHVC